MAYLIRAWDSGLGQEVTYESTAPLNLAPISGDTTPNYTGTLSDFAVLSTTTGVFDLVYVNGYVTRSSGAGTTGVVRNGDASGGINLAGSDMNFRIGLGTGYTASAPTFTWTLQNLDSSLVGTSTQASTYTTATLETVGTGVGRLTVQGHIRAAEHLAVRATINTNVGALIAGPGTSSATHALICEDSAGADLFVVRSDGRVAVTSGARFGVNVLTPVDVFEVHDDSANTALCALAATGPFVGIGTNTPASRLRIVGGTLPSGGFPEGALYVTGTLPDATSIGCYFQITTANSSSAIIQEAMRIALSDGGFGGNQYTAALNVQNGNTGINTDIGVTSWANGAGAHGVGMVGLSSAATLMHAAYFGLTTGTSVLAALPSAALVADNGSVATPIQLWIDNGGEVARMADSGILGIGTTSPSGKLHVVGGEIKHRNATSSGEETVFDDAGVTTTDATVTTLKSFTLSDNTVYLFDVHVLARDTGGTDWASYRRTVRARRQGGGAAAVGTVDAAYTDETAAAWDCTIDTSGNDVRIRVTGAAATTIKWRAWITYKAVS